MKREETIFIAGAHGMVGSALQRILAAKGYHHLLLPTHKELDLTDQGKVRSYLSTHRPAVIIVAAARVGGILANQRFPASFLYENLMIAANVIHSAHECDIDRLLFLGSSCIYPKMVPQPISEEALLTASLEPTNEGYALAKIAGVKLCEYYYAQYGRHYLSLMPTNLYGPKDNYHPTNSHVIAGLMRRFHEAKVGEKRRVEIWGTGKVLREFLYVDDLAEASLLLLEKNPPPSIFNVGSGEELSIRELAEKIAHVVGFEGEIEHDFTKPDGTHRKRLDLRKLESLGWKAKVTLERGLPITYKDFLSMV